MSPQHLRVAGMTAHLAAAAAMAVLLAFQAAPLAAQNLLVNPHFDTGLNGWLITSQTSWDPTLDADGNPRSGSANGFFDSPTPNGADTLVTQSVPPTVAATYPAGAQILIPQPTPP